jgi:hypothetical protein
MMGIKKPPNEAVVLFYFGDPAGIITFCFEPSLHLLTFTKSLFLALFRLNEIKVKQGK